jgi:hypothetical protein
MSPSVIFQLPDSGSSDLILDHPTPEEKRFTWDLNFVEWNGGLSKSVYVEREDYLTKAPLAKDGGITHWVLVQRGLAPNQRPILASSESLRKHTLMSKNGKVIDAVSHGIGSVFCNSDYRGRGYGKRMMTELGKILRTWQAEESPCVFSALWSDIGKEFYAAFGWHAFPSTHVEFRPAKGPLNTLEAKILEAKDLKELCDKDEILVRQSLAKVPQARTRIAMLPSYEQMMWHHTREEFMCKNIYNRHPTIRGAIAGEPGHRIWAIFTRSFYGPLEPASGNTLHILRLVIEDGDSDDEEALINSHAKHLKEILQIARAEAAEWGLKHVELWNPSPLVQGLIEKTGLKHGMVERQKDSIPSLMWYGKGSGKVDEIEWVGNEKFVWC